MDLLLAPDQMILQIHESIGHPLELDRILGDERNYAGTSFVTLDMFGTYRYGSPLLNVVFDPTRSGQFASYAFDDDGTSSVFINGQEFYEDDDFPNSDFSMIELLGTSGMAVDVLLLKRGRTLRAERVIPASVKDALELPQHLEVVPAPLERVESALRRR